VLLHITAFAACLGFVVVATSAVKDNGESVSWDILAGFKLEVFLPLAMKNAEHLNQVEGVNLSH
jgi:hypothetical protein